MADGAWDTDDLVADVTIVRTPTFGVIEGILWALLVISAIILIRRGLVR